MNHRPKISIIIPVLHLERPLNKKRFFIPRHTIKDVLSDIKNNVSISHEIIIVCNGQDPSLTDFISKNSNVDKYCLNSVNVGVARSWNMGAEMAEGETLCFVNDDVEIGKTALEQLYDTLMSSDEIGQVGPMGAKWAGSRHLTFVGTQEIEEADAISGFLFLLREAAYRQAGGFDPAYSPAGFEEIDMSFTLRSLEWKCLVVPNLQIKHHHHHGVSNFKSEIHYLNKSIDTEDLHTRNKAYFESKWV